MSVLLFVHQHEIDEGLLKYHAGRIYSDSSKGSGHYFLGGQQAGAEKTFSIGQPIYDMDGKLMGYLKVGLRENFNYAGERNGEKIPSEVWEIGNPTRDCEAGKRAYTFWQRWKATPAD